MLKVRENLRKVAAIAICLTGFFANDVFAQSNKELAKMYDKLDSLEIRKLELQRESDSVVLDCLHKEMWRYDSGCKNSVGLQGYNSEVRAKSQKICECMVSKKHEIEEVKTKIMQLERRIELLRQDNNKSTQKASPTMNK